MDLRQFEAKKAEDGAEMIVRNPLDGSPLLQDDGEPVVVILLGEDSSTFQKLQRKNTNERLRRNLGGRGRLRVSMEEIESDALELLITCTVGWKGMAWDGEEKDPTPKNIREAYTLFPWLREQAQEFIADRSNFLGN
jgi:hypothetical protein